MTGTVIKILDGDSFIMKSKNKKYEIRMWGIDCPEYTQPYASQAKSSSRKLLDKKNVRVKVKYYDKYDRGIGVVYRNSQNINEELIRLGSAWVYWRYCRSSICSKWGKIEEKAQQEKRGLWGGRDAVPPWEWRRKNG